MKPFCCPVCEGTGLVPAGFYLAIGVKEYAGSSIAPETCRSCNGSGIVWFMKPEDIDFLKQIGTLPEDFENDNS